MESADVSTMTAPLMKHIFRGDLLSIRDMRGSKWSFLILLVLFSAWRPVTAGALTDLEFERSPTTVISSLGKPVKMHCTLKGKGGEEEDPPDVLWLRDGVPLQFADTNQFQVHTGSNSWTVISTLSIEKVQLPDMGSYRCAVQSESHQTLSEEGSIQLEGLPHFSVEPQHMSVVANVSLSLSCVAHGPPEPVRVIWLQDGAPLNSLKDPVALSPSMLNLTGLNRTSTFSCEAHNHKGVATSGSGTITVLPSQPHDLRAVEITQTSLQLSWQPGFGGDYPIIRCSVQAKHSGESFREGPAKMIHNQNVNIPPATHLIGDLEPHSLYAVRVACHSSQGPSDWSPWMELRTKEGVPENPPVNMTAVLNGTEVLMTWEGPPGKLNGELHGYVVEYSTPAAQQFVVDTGLDTELSINLSTPLSNVTFRVCAYTGAGQGPWTPTQTLTLIAPEMEEFRGPSSPPAFSWHWWYVVMAIAGAVSIAVLMAVYVAKLRRKETRFGEAFEPMMESGELVVRYRARRTYSRRTTEATLNSLGISDELKQKLQDVMVDRHKLTLGKTLGEGEFGSVMEGLLTQEESVLKVAVKTMKIAICTRSEMEDFLREAACMKEFDHPNVMRLLGVCLQTVESEGYPSPVVILPYMKHGDLHSYLLYSRLGDCPVYLPSQMLVKFMTDIARGMEYLSSKNFIHRDLAARNCMLNENMNVCVADFGLSKKIYNGDYYRQGRISKMPVKWIAIESLADRVYTTKSDVWSFGVTMWEIATRGQTPYPGVENSEIYDYLRQGNRLKQPPDCLDCIYSLMFSCWLLSPKDRPSFESLRCELEKALEDLPDPQDPDEILYVNMDESSMELGAVGGRDPIGGPSPLCLKGLDSVTTVEVHHPNRYVLCPQHETKGALSDSLESLDMPVSSSTATLPLQPSCRSSPNPTPAPTPPVELLEEREGSRKMPWQ
ncbi:tyrosine-protein kinase receptor UFO [Chelmon rostratus]|uniref:tyrosine-protein kinase receptor UFO n=1 Tax=Chelmon rostratus TaxID=109905 RepID=UPI001BE7CA5E|nr:tyrosine-protein kinase receptor UFO [Chelmon rostratus]